MESGSPEGGALMHYHLLPSAAPKQEEMYLASPTGRRRKKDLLYDSNKRKEDILLAQKQPQPMRNCHHPELMLSSDQLLFKAASPNFLLSFFPYKVMFLSFVCWTCLWSSIACMS